MAPGTGSRKKRRWRSTMISMDQWNTSAPSHSHFADPTPRASPCFSVFVLRNSDRNTSTSSSIRPTTPAKDEGFSILFCLTHGSDFCWPQVVGMRNGTADFPHFTRRNTNPPTKLARAR